MALVVIASAKGAPGVTTLTVALAALAGGCAVAADLDPDGGDLALRYRREDGAPLDPDLGLLSLAASLRRDPTEVSSPGANRVSADGAPVDEHIQVTAGGLEVLLGVTGPDQAIGLGPLWSPLARALTGASRPVFADCGRINPASPAMPVLMQAEAVLMLARAELEELAHLRERLRFLTSTLPTRSSGRARLGVILVAAERDRAAAPRTEQLLRASGVAVPVLGTIADDPRGAARLRGLGRGKAGRTTLVRSVRTLFPAIAGLAGNGLEAPLRAPAKSPAARAPTAPPPAPQPPAEPEPHDHAGSSWEGPARARVGGLARPKSSDPVVVDGTGWPAASHRTPTTGPAATSGERVTGTGMPHDIEPPNGPRAPGGIPVVALPNWGA